MQEKVRCARRTKWSSATPVGGVIVLHQRLLLRAVAAISKWHKSCLNSRSANAKLGDSLDPLRHLLVLVRRAFLSGGIFGALFFTLSLTAYSLPFGRCNALAIIASATLHTAVSLPTFSRLTVLSISILFCAKFHAIIPRVELLCAV